MKVAAGHTEVVNDPTFVGEPLDDRTFSYVCALDDGDDPLEDPTCGLKRTVARDHDHRGDAGTLFTRPRRFPAS